MGGGERLRKLSHCQIAKILSVSPSIVSKYVCKSAELDITCWPLDEKWDDHSLQQAFFKTKPRLKGFKYLTKSYRVFRWIITQDVFNTVR